MKTTTLFALCVVLAASSWAYANKDQKKDQDKHPVYSHEMKTLKGEKVDLSKYKGKVLLIVNTASECGYTKHYAPLQKLHEKYAKDGLAVVGFPCNQFGQQEPGSDEQIYEFCKENYGVEFDMFSKVDVNGKKAAPLFGYLTSKKTGLKDNGPVKWNFEKFLVARDGKVVARYRSKISPDDKLVIKAIEAELAGKKEKKKNKKRD